MKRLQILQKLVYKKILHSQKNSYIHKIAAVILSKICLLKNAKKTCHLNHNLIKSEIKLWTFVLTCYSQNTVNKNLRMKYIFW